MQNQRKFATLLFIYTAPGISLGAVVIAAIIATMVIVVHQNLERFF